MPELPEVETVRRGLTPVMVGHVLKDLMLRRYELRLPFPADFIAKLKGRRMVSLRRRAKYLLLDLEGGETVAMHMGMSGRFTIAAREDPIKVFRRYMWKDAPDGTGYGKHDHVIFVTDDDVRIVYSDPRRFGLMTLVPTAEVEQRLQAQGLGPEPLDKAFTPAILSAALKGKKTPIKSALLDQRVVAGLGNIYVCEALFRAGISPKRLARQVAGARSEQLVPAIKTVLEVAILAGGSSLRDYAQANGELGYFQHQFSVYDRAGKPCPNCGHEIRRIVQAGRSTFYCPGCQK